MTTPTPLAESAQPATPSSVSPVQTAPVTPAESPLPAKSQERGPQHQVPGWTVAVAAACGALACGVVVAGFALLGGSSQAGGEAENRAQVVSSQSDDAEPEPVEKIVVEADDATRSTESEAASGESPATAGESEPEPAEQVSSEPEPQAEPQAQIEPEPQAETEAVAQATPFWGVWIGAFSELSNAQERVALARENGFQDVRMEFSADWTELNQTGYYVVSAGTYASREDAEDVLPAARYYFPDAYVKYSGQHK